MRFKKAQSTQPGERDIPIASGSSSTLKKTRVVTLKPLAYSSPLVIAALCISVYLVGICAWSFISHNEYQKNNYDDAYSDYVTQDRLGPSWAAKWVTKYNIGTTLVAKKSLDEGISYLREALEIVPQAARDKDGNINAFADECAVRQNLAVGLSRQGDQLMQEGKWGEAQKTYLEGAKLTGICITVVENAQMPKLSRSPSVKKKAQSGDSQSGNNPQSGNQGKTSKPNRENHDDPGEKNQKTAKNMRDKAAKAGERADRENKQHNTSSESPSSSASPSSSPSASPSPSPTSQPSPSSSPSTDASSPSNNSSPSDESDEDARIRKLKERTREGDEERQRSHTPGVYSGGW